MAETTDVDYGGAAQEEGAPRQEDEEHEMTDMVAGVEEAAMLEQAEAAGGGGDNDGGGGEGGFAPVRGPAGDGGDALDSAGATTREQRDEYQSNQDPRYEVGSDPLPDRPSGGTPPPVTVPRLALPKPVQPATVIAPATARPEPGDGGLFGAALQLPDSSSVFAQMRQKADTIFEFRDFDEWLDAEVRPHLLEVGEVAMSKDVAEMEYERQAEDEAQLESWHGEIAAKIEEARDEIMHHRDNLRATNTEVEWRLREEEVAARERLVFEHQAMEADLLTRMGGRSGVLQHAPHDKLSWTVEWRRAPQEFIVNITSIRGLRAKLRDGYYVLLVSIFDRLGGSCLRFSTGQKNRDCLAALPPLRLKAKSGQVDLFINKSVQLLCPAAALLQTHAVLVIELWQLKVGKYDPVDKVVGWGAWPLVGRDYSVVEGKFRVPLIRGQVEETVDTYRIITTSLKESLAYWLGNVYFEIHLAREKHEALPQNNREEGVLMRDETAVFTSSDELRLEKTAADFRSLTVAKLPPRLFFDDVALSNHTASSGLRRRFFGTRDLRPLNASLWEKRALLEQEKEALRSDFAKRRSRLLSGDDADDEMVEFRVRQDLKKAPTTFRKPASLVSGEGEDDGKPRDSHVLLWHHHLALASQREFWFLGRRYQDKFAIVRSVLLYDWGVNFGGPWDKTKVVGAFGFAVLGFVIRLYVHNAALYLYLNFLDVPTTRNSWSPWAVDIRFEHTTRFRPADTAVTSLIGQSGALLFFVFFGVALFGLIQVFDRVPYLLTRTLLWYGICVILDPLFTSAYDAYQEDWASGDCFLLYNQMQREEGSGISGVLLSLVIYLCLSFIQMVAAYWFVCAVHLNGRVNDVYERIIFPETSFFTPHDLEVSQTELSEVIRKAKVWRSEDGDVKKINVLALNHHHTSYFRMRLFLLLSTFSNEPEVWVQGYINAIPIRRPYHARDLLEHRMGKFVLGADILDFLRRVFPHLTQMSTYRIGDAAEDKYYEAELVRHVTTHSTSLEDETEVRLLLKSYFMAQVCGGKPAEWDHAGDPEKFIIKDTQMLADLIFFETTSPTMRALLLALHLREFTPDYFSIDEEKESSWGVCSLPNFNREQLLKSTAGQPADGSIIHIVIENPIRGTRTLARVFVVTPFGTIIEPTDPSFTYLASHTADHPEFWAAKAVALGKHGEILE